MTDLLALAAAIQVAEAHIMIPAISPIPGWSPTASAHPTNGPRANLDDMLNVIAGMVAPLGAGSSEWGGTEMEEVVSLLQQPPCVAATGDGSGVAAEFPFPPEPATSLLRLETAQPHPRVGSGCLCRLTLPYGTNDAASSDLALTLNGRELDRYSYYLGSWCTAEEGLTYISFLPNAAYRPGMLRNIIMSLVNRAVWVARDVFHYDLDAHFESTQLWMLAKTEAFARAVESQVRQKRPTNRDPA